MTVRHGPARALPELPVQRWMLVGTTGLLLLLPFITLLIQTLWSDLDIAPWYTFFVLWPPLALPWLWIARGWQGRAWVELVGYFLICTLGAFQAASKSPEQAQAAIGAFFALPMVGVFYRRWQIVALGGLLGVAFDVGWYDLFTSQTASVAARAGVAVAYADAILFIVVGALNALVAFVLQQRESTLLVERALAREHERRFRLLADNSADLIALHEADGRLTYVSPSWETLLGYRQEQLEGETLASLCHPDDATRVERALKVARKGRPVRVVHRMRHRDGSHVWYETLARMVADAGDGGAPRLQSSSRDVSERKAFEEQLSHQAFHDPLTGLPNRTLFLERAGHALTRSRRAGHGIAVLFLDLDNFKNINDSLGHSAGDRLLISFAQRARILLREEDTLARLGGDEFAVVLEDVARPEDASAVAARLESALRQPFSLSGREVYVTVSTGIVLSDRQHTSSEDLMRDADVAMYAAKHAGKARYRTFDVRMAEQSEARLRLDSDLRQAVARRELVLHYQPIVVLDSRQPAGFEALIRWRHPTEGLLPPARFIPIAEENGLIGPIGEWVLWEACRQAQEWQRIYPADPPLFVSVNLSARQFQTTEVLGQIRAILAATGCDPQMLRIEITETVLLVAGATTLAVFEGLRDLGVRLIIDDFGTGYANLSYLQKFRVDALKIDRSFISRLAVDPEETAIVRSLLALAKDLHINVTGEGIETEEQLAHLQAHDCDFGQGFLFSRPVTAEEATRFLASAAANRRRA